MIKSLQMAVGLLLVLSMGTCMAESVNPYTGLKTTQSPLKGASVLNLYPGPRYIWDIIRDPASGAAYGYVYRNSLVAMGDRLYFWFSPTEVEPFSTDMAGGEALYTAYYYGVDCRTHQMALVKTAHWNQQGTVADQEGQTTTDWADTKNNNELRTLDRFFCGGRNMAVDEPEIEQPVPSNPDLPSIPPPASQ